MEEPTKSESLLPTIEKTVKATVGCVALVAAMGFPAVAFYYYRLGVPLSFLSYEPTVWAGAIPGAVLLGTIAYLHYFENKLGAAPSCLQLVTLSLPLWPAIVAALVVVMAFTTASIGFVCYAAGLLLSPASDPESSQWPIVLLGMRLVGAVAIEITLVWTLMQLRSKRRKVKATTPGSGLLAKSFERIIVVGHKANNFLFLCLISPVIGTSVILVIFFLLKNLSPETESALQGFDYCWQVGIGVMFGTMMAVAANIFWEDLDFDGTDPSGSTVTRVNRMAGIGVSLLYALAVFCIVAYPRVPQCLGGGKRSPTNVFLAADPITERELDDLSCSPTDSDKNLLSCAQVEIVHLGDKWVVLRKESSIAVLRESAIVGMVESESPCAFCFPTP